MKNKKSKRFNPLLGTATPQHHRMLCTALMSVSLIIACNAQASDVEVYHQGAQFDKRLMLMVDQSRTMGGAGALDLLKEYPICVGKGVSNILGSGGGLGLLGDKDALELVTNTVGAVDQVALQGLLGGSLDPLLKITTESPSSKYNYARNYCTVVTTDLVVKTLDGLLKPLLGATGLDAKSYIENTCDFQANVKLLNSVSAVGVYRCYDKLSRVKNALTDVLLGNSSTGLKPLPDNVSVGISVMPVDVMTNDRAGRILAPACKLSTTRASDTNFRCFEKTYTGSATTYRNYLVEKIAGNIQSKGDFNLQNVLVIVPKLIAALVGDIFSKLWSILSDPLKGLSELLEFKGTASTVNDLLKTLGLAGNVPTASTYAETGAYLMGTTTKGTGARQMALEVDILQLLGLGLLTKRYNCDAYGTNDDRNWEADGTCKQNAWNYKWLGIGYTRDSSWIVVSNDLVSGLLGDNLLTNIVGAVAKINSRTLYYGYHAQQDSEYSGFSNSVDASKRSTTFYRAPTDTPQCNANGIMVITGGVPNITPTVTDALLKQGAEGLGTQNAIERLMGRSLNTSATDLSKLDLSNVFQCDASAGLKSTTLSSRDYATWSCIGNYTKKLLDKNITTGVIGVGREFTTIPSTTDSAQLEASMTGVNNSLLGQIVPNLLKDTLNVLLGGTLVNGLTSLLGNVFPTDAEDVKNLARWGVLGKGGWYNSASSENIANSIYNFYANLGISNRETFLGVPVVPTDPLTPYNLDNYVFQNMFVPDDKQTWFGNVKKYLADTGETIQTKTITDVWSNSNIQSTKTSILTGGFADKLPTATSSSASSRQLYVNRACITKDKKYDVSASIGLIGNDYYTKLCESQSKDPRRSDLMNLLGYQIQTTNNQESLIAKPEYKKVGMVLHSSPIKITQSATVKNDGSLTRDDYLVFGTVQGLLHVVNASTGVEKFAFLPNELLENAKQRKAFTGTNLEGHDNFNNMQYGIDAPWTAYSEYVWNTKDGKLTVGKSATDATCIKDGVSTGACGKQYLYGGLRMGGRSYYALDLSLWDDQTKPSLKFYIDPASGKVYSSTTPEGKSFDAIKYMGQSWSKPTVAWVNWQGKRKLVMFVGGGYDAGGTDGNANNGGYEQVSYAQSNKIGSGVYMFDAENGDLLWWASNLATTANTGATMALKTNMQYSVVSRINAVDRNGDGLVDHLYFGDLGGQLWRVDINNGSNPQQFAQAAQLLDLQNNKPSDLTDANLRFYEAPIFSVYGYGANSLAVLSIATTNRSLPISDQSAGVVFNLFDNDVTQVSFSTRDMAANNKNLVAYAQLPKYGELTMVNRPQYGWYAKLSNQQKVMDEPVVINKNLYVSIFDPIAQEGRVADCSIGVQGLSSVRRFCLPYGVCEKSADLTTTLKLGKGILPVTIGAGTTSNGVTTRQILGGSSTDRDSTKDVLSSTQTTRRQIVPLKWYEQYTP
ncbi:PilC/PilY family type IV pilus protein [Acinetobacter soli]|uniref:PilC/PilY family type IV pilus protein n=1 Tax=Acinetobacter soli TaxID=487316 RepID=UPI00321836E5